MLAEGEMQDLATFTGYQSSAAINTLLSAPGGGAAICTGGYNPFGIHQRQRAAMRTSTASLIMR